MEVELKFERRVPTARPRIEVEVSRAGSDAWPLFRPYHYMSAELVKQAKCFGAFVADQIVAFVAVIHFPHPLPSACGYRRERSRTQIHT